MDEKLLVSFGEIGIVGKIGESTRYFLKHMYQSEKYTFPLNDQIEIVGFASYYLKPIVMHTPPTSLFFLKIPKYLFRKFSREFNKISLLYEQSFISLEYIPSFLTIKHLVFRFLADKARERTNAFAFDLNGNLYIRLYGAEKDKGVRYFETFSPSKDLVDRLFPSLAPKLVELQETHPIFVEWLDNQIIGNTRDFNLVKRAFYCCTNYCKNLFIA